MAQTLRTVGAVLVGAAVVGALAACGESDSIDPHVQHALDSALADGDFPAGYHFVKLGAEDATAITDQLDDSRKDATVSPAECRSRHEAPDAADTGRAVAVRGDATLSASVAVSSVDVAALLTAVTGECAQVTVDITTGSARGTVVDVAHRDVRTPDVDGHRGVVLTQISTVRGGDGPRSMLIGRVPVDGYLVVVQAANADGSTPDRAAFDETLTAAVGRVGR